MNITPKATANDTDVIDLSKAIIQHESGGNPTIKGASKEYGLAQWVEPTWNAEAKKYLGYVPKWGTDEMTPAIQKAVLASKVADRKNAGLNPAQISAEHNSGSSTGWENKIGVNQYGVKYNVPAYVKSVTDLYQQNKTQRPQQVMPEAQTQQPSEFNPLFPSSPTDSPFMAGAKTLGNVIPSAINFGKNVLSAINPINTIKNIGQIGSEFQALSQEQGGAVNALAQTAQALPQSLYEGTVPTAGRELIKAGYQGVTGQDNTQSLQNAQQAITEDPFGQIAPFVLGARQLAERAGVVKQFDDFIKKGVDATLKPVTAPAKFVGEKTGQVARGAIGQATGLNPETVKALIDNPELYTRTARQNINRSAIASKVGTALDDLETQVSDTGTGYNAIRENTGVTYIAPTFLSEALKPFNIKLQNGKIITTAESLPLNRADVSALQEFVDKYGNERFLTNNAFLNARTALSDLSKYDAQKTGKLQTVSRTLREAYDAIGKEKIEGLKNLDEQFAPLKRQFELLKKDYLKKEDGEYVFKDGAVTKLANLDKVGRGRILGRLEELVPDIGKEIRMLKVVEDIERASGIKVGTYGKGALLGAGLLSGGVVGAIISAILTSPEIAVPLIRGYGLTKAQTTQVLMNLRLMLGETKQSGMDLLQKEIPVEDMVNALTGKGIPNRQGGFIKNPLAKVDNSETYYRGEGGTNVAQGKALLAEGKHFAMDSEYPKGFGKVSEYKLKPNTKVLDLGDSTFAEMSQRLGIPERKYISPKDLSAIAKEKGYDVLKYNGEYKSTGKPFVHTVDLTGDSFVPKSSKNPLSQSDSLIQEAKKYKSADEFVKAQGTPLYHGTPENISILKNTRIGENNYGKGGIFLTPDKAEAFNYGGGYMTPNKTNARVLEAYISPKAKIKEIDGKKLFNDEQVRDDKIAPLVRQAEKEGYDGVVVKNTYTTSKTTNLNKTKNEIEKIKSSGFMDKVNEDILSKIKSGTIRKTKEAVANAYNRVMAKYPEGKRIQELEKTLSDTNQRHVVIFNDKVIKTSSQLKDIWNSISD